MRIGRGFKFIVLTQVDDRAHTRIIKFGDAVCLQPVQGVGAKNPAPLCLGACGGVATQIADIVSAGNWQVTCEGGGHQRHPDFMKDWMTCRCRTT